MAREHIKAQVIHQIEQSMTRRIEGVASKGGMTDAQRAELERLKAKTLHVAHEQPADFFESCWRGDDVCTVKLAMLKLQPLVRPA